MSSCYNTERMRIEEAYRKMTSSVVESQPTDVGNSDVTASYDAAKREFDGVQLEIAKNRLFGDRSRIGELNAKLDVARKALEQAEAAKTAKENEELERRRQAVVARNRAVRQSKGLYDIDNGGRVTEIGGDAVDYANRKYGSLDGRIKANPNAVE